MLSDDEFDSLGFTFTWRIENFIYALEDKDYCITSPEFVMNSSVGQTAWNLQVYPRGKGDNDFIRYNLRKERFYGTNCISLDYQLSILASDGSLTESIECEKGWFHQGATCLAEKCIAQDELFGNKKDFFLPHDTLTFHCRMWDNGKVRSWLGQGFARTRIDVEKWSLIWEIEEFSTLQLAQNKCFCFSHLKEDLSLKLYLTAGLDCDKKIQVDISETDASQDNWIRFKIAVVNSESCLEFLAMDEHWFEEEDVDTQFWNFPTSISKSTLLANKDLYLPNDTLSLQCDCVLSIGVVYSELENAELGPYAKPHVNSFIPEVHQHRRRKESVVKVSDTLKADLLNIFTEKTFCDFELRAGSETFSVHKAIIGARSPVFQAMISSDMVEKKSNTVDIPDLDGETVKRMLHFMYTDSIEGLQWEDISKLYYAADKYGIQSLKQKCSSFLVSNLFTSNVCEAMELGDLHEDNALKAAAKEFIFRNDDKILSSDEWKQLLKRKGQLAAEIMQWMYLKKIGQINIDTVLSGSTQNCFSPSSF